MFLLFSLCCGGSDGAEVIQPPPQVFHQVEMEKIKKDIEETNQKLDCIPEILDKKVVSENCKKLITLKK